jgi:hypothetical protein
MAKLIYWMVFQILVGIWVFISPFVLGYGEKAMGQTMIANSMILGAVVALIGLGISLFSDEVCSRVGDTEKGTI